MEREERRNAWKLATAESFFGTGFELVSGLTVLPLLLTRLGAGDVMLGLAVSIAMAGWIVGQPVGMLLLGGKRRTKTFLLPWSGAFSIPPHLAMAALVFFLAPVRPMLCAGLLLTVFAIRVVGAGFVVPFWFDWHASLFSRRVRGRAIGMIVAASGIGATLAAFISSRVRAALPLFESCSLLYLISGLLFIAFAVAMATVREPDRVLAPRDALRLGDMLGRFRQSLGEKNFRNYLTSRILVTLGAAAFGFYAVHFEDAERGLTQEKIFALGALAHVSRSAAGYLLGRLGDRAGHKAGVLAGTVAQLGALAIAFLATGWVACAACFALTGVFWASGWVSHGNMLFETCPHDSRPVHITLSNVVLSPFAIGVPLATGWMMHAVGRQAGFGLLIVPVLAAVLWTAFVVKEPRVVALLPDNPDAAEEG